MSSEANDSALPRGLRSSVGAACRAALREVLDHEARDLLPVFVRDHLEVCVRCRAHVRSATRLGAWLVVERPKAPAELSSVQLVEAIHERIVEAAEAGPIDAWLASARVELPDEAVVADWSDAVLERRGIDRDAMALDANAVDAAARYPVAQRLMSAPPAPGAEVWSRVRESILERVSGLEQDAGDRDAGDGGVAASSRGPANVSAVSSRVTWKILLAGAAASIAISLLSWPERAVQGAEIVFVDLDHAPGGEFGMVRHGVRR